MLSDIRLIIFEEALKSLIISKDSIDRVEDLIERVRISFSFIHVIYFFVGSNLFHDFIEILLQKFKISCKKLKIELEVFGSECKRVGFLELDCH